MINIFSNQKIFNKILYFLFIILIFLFFYKSTEKMSINISNDNKLALENFEEFSKKIIEDSNNNIFNITEKFLGNDAQYFRKYNIISDLSIKDPNELDYYKVGIGNFNVHLENIKKRDNLIKTVIDNNFDELIKLKDKEIPVPPAPKKVAITTSSSSSSSSEECDFWCQLGNSIMGQPAVMV